MDVLCQAKSGMGKTAVFVLSVLQQLEPQENQVAAVIVCHTRELAFQVIIYLSEKTTAYLGFMYLLVMSLMDIAHIEIILTVRYKCLYIMSLSDIAHIAVIDCNLTFGYKAHQVSQFSEQPQAPDTDACLFHGSSD